MTMLDASSMLTRLPGHRWRVQLAGGWECEGTADNCIEFLDWHLDKHVQQLVADRLRSERRRDLLTQFRAAAEEYLSGARAKRAQLPRRLPLHAGWWVYVAESPDGTTQYVGMTSDIYTRLGAHKARSAWYGDCGYVTLIRAKDKNDAAKIERRMIRSLRPVHNLA